MLNCVLGSASQQSVGCPALLIRLLIVYSTTYSSPATYSVVLQAACLTYIGPWVS